jgi:hypothetical protein
MAELTHLNEASVVHNLQMRYQSDLIYVRTIAPIPYPFSSLTCSSDIFRALLSHGESVLPSPYILERIYKDVQRAEQGRHKASRICHGRPGIPKSCRGRREPEHLSDVSRNHSH